MKLCRRSSSAADKQFKTRSKQNEQPLHGGDRASLGKSAGDIRSK